MAKEKKTLEEKLNEAIVKDGPYEVPGNWVWSSLGCLVELKSGGSIPEELNNPDGQYLYVKVGDMNLAENNNEIVNSIFKLTNITGLEGKLIPSNSIIFPKRGGAIATNKRRKVLFPILIDTNTMAIVVPEKLNYDYIYYWFLSIDLWSLNSGSSIPQINNKDIEPLRVPLPPLKEQQRIVHRIESLFEKLDKAKELIEEAREGFEKRKAAVLEKAFRGELTEKWRAENKNCNLSNLVNELRSKNKRYKNYEFNETYNAITLPHTWRFTKLDSISSKITDGSHNPPKKQEGGYPMISAKNITNGIFDLSKTDRYVLEEDFKKEDKRTKIQNGDILLAIIGASIGNIAIYNTEDKVVAQRSLCIINTYVNNKFIYYMLRCDYLQKEMLLKSTGTAQPGLYLNSVRELIVPLPPFEEQKEIVRILDKLLEDESKVQELTQLEEQIELIKKSILAKAFRDELGTNCEEDESALELLKEILSKQ